MVLHLAQASTEQIIKYRKDRFQWKMKRNKPEFQDTSDQCKLALVEQLMVDVSGLNDNGEPVEVEYRGPDGQSHPLTPQVENWKSYIAPEVKIAAGSVLDREEADFGDEFLKN
ncbi:MAG: hypothetical protein IID18_01845 [Nitrospinae bacterium]|nr:hypothetical protein [Nitrospinota bacterium]